MCRASYRIISFHTQHYMHQNLETSDGSLLYVSAPHRSHHQGVLTVANIAPSKWPVAK